MGKGVQVNIKVVAYTEEGRQELTAVEWCKLRMNPKTTLHRVDGPALEWPGGRYEIFWYIDNQAFTESEFNKLIQEVKDMPLVVRLVDPRWWVREFVND